MSIPHPYESLYRPCAYIQPDGNYQIRGKTYPVKDKIKSVGATWDSKIRAWKCTPEQLKELLKKTIVLVMIKVHVPKHCHEDEEDILATHKEVEYGAMILGCGWCDTTAACGDVVKIEKIIDIDSYNLVKDNK